MEQITQLLDNPLVLLAFAIGILILLIIALVSGSSRQTNALGRKIDELEGRMQGQLTRVNDQAGDQAQKNREEMSQNVRGMGDSVTRIMGEMARTQQSQLDAFAGQLRELKTADEQRMESMRQTVDLRLTGYQDKMDRVSDVLDDKLTRNDEHIERLRQSIEQRMESLQRDNSVRLQQIEHTVDEQLGATLDRRMQESFRLVSDRLDRVYQGLGEMQNLTAGMSDLKRVLSGVHSRGQIGEIQLGALLSQLMSPEQYQTDVRIRPNGPRVGYAIVLPGRNGDHENSLLPIDASMPHTLYDRLIDAAEQGDHRLCEQLSDQLADAVREAAGKAARDFIDPPMTTDFCVLFLGSEGLYAELLKKPGLFEELQRQHHITLCGPSTLSALLNSLQMGMKTMMLERRSEEVWGLLGAVRGEITTFAGALQRTQKRIRQASESIEDAARTSQIIQKKLSQVDQVDGSERKLLLRDELGAADQYENSDWD